MNRTKIGFVGHGYREIQPGEILLKTDEFQSDWADKHGEGYWTRTSAAGRRLRDDNSGTGVGLYRRYVDSPNAAFDEELGRLRQELTEAKQDVSDIKLGLEDAQREIESLNTVWKSAEAELADLHERNIALKKRHQELIDENAVLREEREATAKMLNDRNALLADLFLKVAYGDLVMPSENLAAAQKKAGGRCT